MAEVARVARAVFRATSLHGANPPYDRIILKIWYPALPGGSDDELNTGLVPADEQDAPYRVIIVMPGINVDPESYAWFASAMCERGHVVVTYSLIAEEMPGHISLTPGLDLAALTPDTYGRKPTSTALQTLIACLQSENESGLLEQVIDTNDIVLVGHSGGGSVALFNAHPDWFPGVTGAVAYAAHSGASTMLGFEDNTILDLPSTLPLLLIGGTRDGVIAASAHRYGDDTGNPLERLRQTFADGMHGDRGDNYLVEIDGANHFSFAWPQDNSTARAFLDWPETADGGAIRGLIIDLVSDFVAGNDLGGYRQHDLVSALQQR